jgi:hypothetical protein
VFTRARKGFAGAIPAFGRILERQAEMLSYIDVFKFLAIVCACLVPVAFLLRKINPEEAHASG